MGGGVHNAHRGKGREKKRRGKEKKTLKQDGVWGWD